jgi:hypothetical protein
MLKNLLIIIFGTISLIAILNYFHVTNLFVTSSQKPECINTFRYDKEATKPGGGTAISDEAADSLADDFKVKYLSDVYVQQSYFSKKAIDHLFAKYATANAIGCTYALVNDSLKIIINAYRIEQTGIEIPEELDSTYFLQQQFARPRAKSHFKHCPDARAGWTISFKGINFVIHIYENMAIDLFYWKLHSD